MKLDFVVAGAQKCGTTALRQMLSAHPELAVPADELHIFDRGRSLRTLLPQLKPGLRGDVTPIYIYWQDCPERIREHNPRIKVIAILRDPVKRAWSHWKMDQARGRDPSAFGEAIRLEDARLNGNQSRSFSYADRGRYGWQVERLLRLFGNNLLVLKYEDYRADHQAALERIFVHLGVAAMPVERKRARVTGPEQMAAEDHAYLAEKLEPEARRVEALLGWNCRDWCRAEG